MFQMPSGWFSMGETLDVGATGGSKLIPGANGAT